MHSARMDAAVQPVRLHKLPQLQMISRESWCGTLAFPGTSAYHIPMLSPEQTTRRRIIELLTGAPMTSHQLARALSIAERLVEEHLAHVVKTVTRERSRRFLREPSSCLDCGFMFRDRTRLTRPSRCPQCRSEGISPPRYHIESLASGTTHDSPMASRRRDSGKG
jgi:transcriptional regulator